MKFYYLLHPRPVIIIGSGSFKNNEMNFMSVSWITPLSEDPPTIGFSSYKENYSNFLIEKYGQFSVIIINDVDLIWKIGTVSGREKNKIKEFNLNVISGKKIDVPILKDCLGFLECKLVNKIDVGECIFYIGEVLNWEAKDIERYGWKNPNKIPLHVGGRRFTFSKD